MYTKATFRAIALATVLISVGCGEEDGKDDTGVDTGSDTGAATTPTDTGLTPTTDTAPVPTTDTAPTPTPTADTSIDVPTMPIAGTYTDSFYTGHVITDDTWTQQYADYAPYVFALVEIDSVGQYALAENDVNNPYGAGLFSRFDWAYSGADLYYCQTAFGAATLDEARDTPAADALALDTGCGGFPWSQLLP